VTAGAQALQRYDPEVVGIASVQNDVVGYGCGREPVVGETQGAQGFAA
jgi:hypothetical protein